MILTECEEDWSRGFLFFCPSYLLLRQNQSKDRICFWKPICHRSFSKANSAFNVTHMKGSMSNLRAACKWASRSSGCVRSSHQQGREEGVCFTSHGQILRFIGVSAELVSLDAVTTRMLMSCRAHWLVLIGLLKGTEGKHELYFVGIVNNNKLPTKENWITCSRRLDAPWRACAQIYPAEKT